MQTVVISLGAITADYFNIMINHAIANKSVSNGLTIAVIFAMFFILEELMHYVLSLYSAKHFKINFQYLSRQLMQTLQFKKKTFFKKVDSNYFYLIDTAMQSITVFLTTEIVSLCSNVLLVLVATVVIGVLNY
jgi:ABC-type bacteriocin/lantibiotic exporter with double-glycine peptidase domain